MDAITRCQRGRGKSGEAPGAIDGMYQAKPPLVAARTLGLFRPHLRAPLQDAALGAHVAVEQVSNFAPRVVRLVEHGATAEKGLRPRRDACRASG